MAKAKDFTWATVVDNKTIEGLKYNVTNAMVWTTTFASSLFMDNPRGQDHLTLYPMRHIWVSFDKFYPGNVYGMNVYVWADTGEIGHFQERFSTVDPPTELVATADDIASGIADEQATGDKTQSNSLLVMIMLPAFAVLMVGTVTVYLGKKKSLPRSLALPKSRSLKIGGVLLCFLIASTTLFAVLATPVDGLPLYGRATIWGSESKDAWNSTLNLSWRKHPNEVTRQVATSAFIRSEFDQNGYSASDYQGVKGSDKNSILYQIQTNQANYPRVAVVDFDHGNGNNETHLMGAPDNEFHYMFEDQRGTYSGPVCHPYPPDHREYGVYDMEIYPWTGSGKYFFVLINACNSAHNDTTFGQYPSSQGIIPGTNRARGMPFAWTHRLVENRDTYQGFNTAYHMSDDGYARPDNGEFVYLGFYMGSAALTQDVAAKDGSMRPYWYWLEHFISYAVRNNWSVKQVLNEASQQFYGGSFGEIPLHTNYISIWPTFYKNATESQPSWHNDYGPNSQMRVYGNSNIKLYQPLLTLAANGGLSPTFTITVKRNMLAATYD